MGVTPTRRNTRVPRAARNQVTLAAALPPWSVWRRRMLSRVRPAPSVRALTATLGSTVSASAGLTTAAAPSSATLTLLLRSGCSGAKAKLPSAALVVRATAAKPLNG